MAKLSSKNTSGLMFLSMGVFALLLITYFAMSSNANLSPLVGAHRQTSMVGKLVKDINHKLSCNLVAKADYVLVDEATPSAGCIPVVANPSDANNNVGQTVEISGANASGMYFAVNFRRLNPSGSPRASMYPRPTGVRYIDPPAVNPN